MLSPLVAPMSEQNQPHDPEVEKAVLGCCLLDAEAIYHVAALLTPESFYVPRHAALWTSFQRISGTGNVIDVVSIQADLHAAGLPLSAVGGLDYVAELALFVPSSSAVRRYGELVAPFCAPCSRRRTAARKTWPARTAGSP